MRSADARVSIAILIAIRLVDKWTMPRRIHGTDSSTGNALPAGSSISPMQLVSRLDRFDFDSVRFFLAKIVRNARENYANSVSMETVAR